MYSRIVIVAQLLTGSVMPAEALREISVGFLDYFGNFLRDYQLIITKGLKDKIVL